MTTANMLRKNIYSYAKQCAEGVDDAETCCAVMLRPRIICIRAAMLPSQPATTCLSVDIIFRYLVSWPKLWPNNPMIFLRNCAHAHAVANKMRPTPFAAELKHEHGEHDNDDDEDSDNDDINNIYNDDNNTHTHTRLTEPSHFDWTGNCACLCVCVCIFKIFVNVLNVSRDDRSRIV